MSKSDDYKEGWKDGRANTVMDGGSLDYRRGYSAGKQEYDFWNDKELYPNLGYDGESGGNKQVRRDEPIGGERVGGGAVLMVILGWMVIFGPMALFLSWEDLVVKIVFWGGLAIVLLVVGLWFAGMIEEGKR